METKLKWNKIHEQEKNTICQTLRLTLIDRFETSRAKQIDFL